MTQTALWGTPLTSRCDDCQIRWQAICADCDSTELALLEALKSYRHVAKGEAISHAGDRLSHVGTLISGTAYIAQNLADGRRQIVGLLFPGDFTGDLGSQPAAYDIIATSPVLMCRFEMADFEQVQTLAPHLAARLLKQSMEALDTARQWMVLLGRKTAREKVASLFHQMALKTQSLNAASRAHEGQDGQFDLPLTREALADYLGLTVETVSRQITALRDDGVISTQGYRHISIADMARLRAETGDHGSKR